MIDSQIKYLRTDILNTLQDIDADRYLSNRMSIEMVNKLSALVESFAVLSKCSGNSQLLNESSMFEKKLESLSYEMAYRRHHKLYEGFENPFDDYQDLNSNLNKPSSYNMLDNNCSGINIKKILPWTDNKLNKFNYVDGKMKSGIYYGKGDTIETCPVRIFYDRDMYSENIREFAFPIGRGIYGIPFGYATFYRNSTESGESPNIEYVYFESPDGVKYIKIIALKTIRPNEELVLYSDKSNFANEIRPNMFNRIDYDTVPVKPKKYKFS